MSEIDKDPKPRVIRSLQSPIREEEIWGGDRYVNHELDLIFEAAEKDPLRPEEAHVGWWAVRQELKKDSWDSGKVLMDLPLRYEEDLEPIKNLEELFAELNPDPGVIYSFISSFDTRHTILMHHCRDWKPEPSLSAALSVYYSTVHLYLFQKFIEVQQREG